MASHGNVSQAEMWDDSALVDSWNEALEEYKQYHSIQARGEKTEEVLKAHEKSNGVSESKGEDGQIDEQNGHDHQSKHTQHEETADHDTRSPGNASQVRDKQSVPDELPCQAPDMEPKKGPTLPQHLIGQVHDDSLKNLLMSWYYAGYYTGLYEGQQQRGHVSSAKHKN